MLHITCFPTFRCEIWTVL